jgi:nucleoside 2-deoxyribosyltransferase
MTTEHTIYFAGDLFDHKDLIGNALMASYINQVSEGRYRCVLPQDLEQTSARSVDIRNQDQATLMECDLAIFNFDGLELDSGTVVEFMYAKMLDIPCVVIRSDFRRSGDQGSASAEEGDDWNLMASFYPRSRKLQFNAMELYQQEVARGGPLDEITSRLYTRIATAMIEALDQVKAEPSILTGDNHDIARVYNWALKFPGGGLTDAPVDVAKIIQEKIAKGILRASN